MRKMYNKICSFLCLLCASGFVYGQDLHVSSVGNIFIESTSFLSASNVVVDAGGDVTVSSDANNSGSLLLNGTADGDFIYNRYLASSNWYLVSAPVTTQGINAFATEVANGINTSGAKYAIGAYNNTNPTGDKWEYYTTSTLSGAGNFNTGQGYTFNRTSAGTLSFKGELVDAATVSVPMVTASGTHRWFSIGNPFTSFLPVNNTANAGALNVLGQNIATLDSSYAALYVWDGTNYVVVNHVTAALQLAPGQAFVVKAKDENEQFIFTKSLTNHPLGLSTFYKDAGMPSLQLFLNDGEQEKYTEIKYLESATTGLDVGYDAGTYSENTESFAIDSHLVTDSSGINFTLQCLPDNTYEKMVIPLVVTAAAGKTIIFSATSSNLPSDMNVFIEDKTLATYKLLEANNEYKVVLSKEASGIGRFYVHTTTQSVLATEDFDKIAINLYKAGNNLKITGITGGKKSSISLYSILGQEIFTHSLTSANGVQSIALPKAISVGVYIAKLRTETGKEFSKKILINE